MFGLVTLKRGLAVPTANFYMVGKMARWQNTRGGKFCYPLYNTIEKTGSCYNNKGKIYRYWIVRITKDSLSTIVNDTPTWLRKQPSRPSILSLIYCVLESYWKLLHVQYVRQKKFQGVLRIDTYSDKHWHSVIHSISCISL